MRIQNIFATAVVVANLFVAPATAQVLDNNHENFVLEAAAAGYSKDIETVIQDMYDENDALIGSQEILLQERSNEGATFGIKAGATMSNSHVSPMGGIEFRWTRGRFGFAGSATFAAGKYNSQSEKAGKLYYEANLGGELQFKMASFRKNGKKGQQGLWLTAGYERIFRADYNVREFDLADGDHLSDFIEVEGSSNLYTLGLRYDINHFLKPTASSIGVKVGVYNEYYLHGAQKRFYADITYTLRFKFAKKNVNKAAMQALQNY